MESHNAGTTAFNVNSTTLASLNDDALIDFLTHKTRLLVAAAIARLPDREYINQLNVEVEALQSEIQRRRLSQ